MSAILVLLFMVVAFLVVVSQRTSTIAFNKEALEIFEYKPINTTLIYICSIPTLLLLIGSALSYTIGSHIAFILALLVSVTVIYFVSKHIEKETNKETAIKSSSLLVLYGSAIWFFPVAFSTLCSDKNSSNLEKQSKWFCKEYWW